jgi:hypothetical protein
MLDHLLVLLVPLLLVLPAAACYSMLDHLFGAAGWCCLLLLAAASCACCCRRIVTARPTVEKISGKDRSVKIA